MAEEKQWIKLIKSKSDNDSANNLISKYYKEVYSYVYKQTIDKELSMDMTQEIFIKLLRSINNYDERKSSFRTWIYRVATFTMVDYYRSKYYKYNDTIIPLDDYENIQTDIDFTISIEYEEEVEIILSVLNRFDTFRQQILRLKIFSECTFKEISEILNISESTVKTRYYSTIRKLKDKLEENQYGKE